MDVFDTDEAKRHHDNLLEILEKVNFIDDKNSAVALFTEGINRLSKHHGINGMSTFAAMFVDAWQMFAMNHFVGSIANKAVNSTVEDMFKKAGLDGGKSMTSETPPTDEGAWHDFKCESYELGYGYRSWCRCKERQDAARHGRVDRREGQSDDD